METGGDEVGNRIKRCLFIALIVTILLGVFIGLIYIIFHVNFGFSKTITASIIAFTGSVLGGGLTLIGVVTTINSNKRLREKDELPKKIHHLESAIVITEETINEELTFKDKDIYNLK